MAVTEIKGLPEALGDMQMLFARVNSFMATALAAGLTNIANEAKRLAPHGAISHLANSIRPNVPSGTFLGQNLRGEIIADTPYAAAHEFGSGLHGERGAKYPIRPKNKKALRWPVQGFIGPTSPGQASVGSSSGFAFAKVVMHPGVKATRYFERAAESSIDDLAEEMLAAFELAVLGD